MKKIYITINIIALIGSITWLYTQMDFEPLITMLGLLGSLVILISNYLKSIKPKKIAIVMSDIDEVLTIPKEFKQGFGTKSIIDREGQKIEIKYFNDQYSIAEHKKIIKEVALDKSYVLLILNSNSMYSNLAIEGINEFDKVKIPILIPIATVDNLSLKTYESSKIEAIRLLPENRKEVSRIKEFVFSNFTKEVSVVILIDEENPEYSYNIGRNLANEIISEGGKVIQCKAYGNNNRFLSLHDLLTRNQISYDIIIYAGISTNGYLLLQELDVIGLNKPVILSSGCLVENLVKKGSFVLGENIYFLSPVSISNKEHEPSYYQVGKDTYEICEGIINNIDNDVTRENIFNYFQKHKTSKVTIQPH